MAALILLSALAPSVSRLLDGRAAGAMLLAGCVDLPVAHAPLALQAADDGQAGAVFGPHEALPDEAGGHDPMAHDHTAHDAAPDPAEHDHAAHGSHHAQAPDAPPASPRPPSHDHHSLCPFCLPHAGSTGFLPLAVPLVTVPAEPVHEAPPLYYSAPRPLFAWSAPLARAPPLAA